MYDMYGSFLELLADWWKEWKASFYVLIFLIVVSCTVLGFIGVMTIPFPDDNDRHSIKPAATTPTPTTTTTTTMNDNSTETDVFPDGTIVIHQNGNIIVIHGK